MIYIVEDDAAIRELEQYALQSSGYEVQSFETSEPFWQAMRTAEPELVILDVLKPGGIFFICNDANGETAKDDKWTQIINGMTIYTDTALKAYLEQAGFCRIKSHKNKKGWLCVTARK